MPGRLNDRVAIITAGGAGIGAATARRFASEGAAVVVADLSGTRAQAVTEEIKSAGGRAVFIKMDAADPEAIQATIKLAIDSYGRLDVMFNNAGHGRSLADSRHHSRVVESCDGGHADQHLSRHQVLGSDHAQAGWRRDHQYRFDFRNAWRLRDGFLQRREGRSD